MTRAKSRTIAKILNKNLSLLQVMYANNHELDITDNDEVALETVSAEALKEIQTLIKASKPEKDRIVKSSGDSRLDQMVQRKIDGYNNGIDDYEANLLKILQ